MKKTFTLHETAQLYAGALIAPLYSQRHDLYNKAERVLEVLVDNDIDVIIKSKDGLVFNPSAALSCTKLIEVFSSPQEWASALSKAVVPFIEEALKKDLMNGTVSNLPSSPLE